MPAMQAEHEIYADPISSGDDQTPASTPPAPSLLAPREQTGRVYPRRVQKYTALGDVSRDEQPRIQNSQDSLEKRTEKKPTKDVDPFDDGMGTPQRKRLKTTKTFSKSSSQGSIGKRPREILMEDENPFDNGMGTPPRKRPTIKKTFSKNQPTTKNFHVPPKPTTNVAKGHKADKDASGFQKLSPSPKSSPTSKKPGFSMPEDIQASTQPQNSSFSIPAGITAPSISRPKFQQTKSIEPLLPNASAFRVPDLMPSDFVKTLHTAAAIQMPSSHSNQSSSPLSSPASSTAIMSSQAQPDHSNPNSFRAPSPEPIGSICPMCRAPVEDADLYAFSAAHDFKLNVRLQEMFCRQHKQKAALDDYAARGYPKIIWQKLEAHMEEHTERLEAVLEGREASVYRDKLAESVRTGSNRNLLSAIMTEEFKVSTTGYYGARGARVMMEYITKAFAPQIRRLAPTDKVIASGGMSKFVQAVLLPELVIRLVMDDMKVGEERATEIIKESGEVGDLVHEEDDDAVRRDEFGNKYVVLPENMDSEGDESDDGDEHYDD